MVAAGSDRTRAPPVWDVESGELRFTLQGHSGMVRSVTFSPDGRHILTGSRDGIRLWDAATGAETAATTSGGGIWHVAFARDGSLIATGYVEGGLLELRDATTLEKLQATTAHEGSVLGIAFTSDGRLVTAGGDALVKVWDLDQLESPLLTMRGHAGSVNQVTVSPDGSRIATGGEDRVAKIWDAASGLELMTLYGHAFAVYGVDFSPDGRLLATGSADGTVALHLLPIDEFVELARTRVSRSLTNDECRQYLHLDACPDR
jgi:WD40 repeat protein